MTGPSCVPTVSSCTSVRRPGGIRNVHRMVCAAFDQARTLRRIDIQHGKRSRPRLDSPYPRDQRSAGCGEEPSGTHLQREAAQRFRKGLYLRQDGFGARIRLRTGKAGPVADAKTAAKVNCIYRGVGFLIQRLCQRGKLGEDSGIEVLVHAQLAQPHTEAKPAYAACAQAFRRAQERFAFHPGIGGRDARHRLRAEAERALLPQEQNYGLPALLRAAARLRPARKLRRAYAQLSPLPRCGSTARRRFSCHGSRTGRQAPAPQGSCKARRSRSCAEFAEPWDSDSCGWESAARIRCSRKMHGKEPALPARDSFHRIKTGASRRFSKTARAFLKKEHTAH